MGGQRRSLEVLKFRQERRSTLCPANSLTVAQFLTKLLTRGPHLPWPCILRWWWGVSLSLLWVPATPEGFWLMPICPDSTYIKRKPNTLSNSSVLLAVTRLQSDTSCTFSEKKKGFYRLICDIRNNKVENCAADINDIVFCDIWKVLLQLTRSGE